MHTISSLETLFSLLSCIVIWRFFLESKTHELEDQIRDILNVRTTNCPVEMALQLVWYWLDVNLEM